MYKEIPLQGYDGFVACDDGHIYKKDNFDYTQVKEYSQDGYLLASIPNNKFNQVHRIIASTFCLNSDPSTKRIVDHKDGNKLNNKVDNLEWVTQKENVRRARERGLVPLSTKILCIENNTVYDSISGASKKLGMRYESIRGCLQTGKSVNGLHFERNFD